VIGSEAAAQQFTNCSGPTWHALVKPPIVDSVEFVFSQHDLQAFRAPTIIHSATP
jgi:hypothetical protein